MSRRSRGEILSELSDEIRGWQADQELFDSVVADLAGLNRTDWRCLDLLGTRGSMTAGQLADAAHLTTGAVTGVVDHLEAAGLVRRIRDTVDRRRVIIETTEEVERRGAPVYGPLIEDSAALFKAYDANQLETIVDFVRRTRGLLAKHTARLHEMHTRTMR
jgi:DNA-binding MarR family transcriptional regulator